MKFTDYEPEKSQQLSQVYSQKILGDFSRKELLKAAIIWHDTAKRFTLQVGADGQTSTWSHEVLGSASVADLASRCQLSHPETEWVTHLVEYHGLINSVLDYSLLAQPRAEVFTTFVRKVGVQSLDLYLHMMADILGSNLTRLNPENFQKRMGLLQNWILSYGLTRIV